MFNAQYSMKKSNALLEKMKQKSEGNVPSLFCRRKNFNKYLLRSWSSSTAAIGIVIQIENKAETQRIRQGVTVNTIS